jgi:predicted dehydrogenase
MTRREAIGAVALAPGLVRSAVAADATRKVRIGVIGTGGRGSSLLQIALLLENVDVPALCDINREHLAKATDMVITSGRPKPEGYTGEEDYKRLIDRDDIDGVLIATPWELHAPMGIYSMKAKKYTGIEVPIGITTKEFWDLINTQEQTGTPCMMLENWSFRRDNLAVLNIIRKGLLGDVSYAHCAYAHDCNDIWFFDDKGEFRWPGRYLTKRNADQYPTHGLGPVMSWMDINCGDYPAYLTSTASRAISVNHHFTKKFGPDHPMAKQKFKQGDFVVTVIRTMQGKTIVVYNDMVSPRPYDNRWEISGTNGIYSQAHNGIYIEGMSPVNHGEHGWENFDTYQDKFDHAWHKEIRSVVGGLKTGVMAHGAPDYLVVKKFVDAAAVKGPMPITIYDSVLMSAPVPLSEESIAKGSAPVAFPDFTRGKWKTNKPYFAIES